MKAVRIKHWIQDTAESGHWELTGMIKKTQVEKVLYLYDNPEIIDNDEDY